LLCGLLELFGVLPAAVLRGLLGALGGLLGHLLAALAGLLGGLLDLLGDLVGDLADLLVLHSRGGDRHATRCRAPPNSRPARRLGPVAASATSASASLVVLA